MSSTRNYLLAASVILALSACGQGEDKSAAKVEKTAAPAIASPATPTTEAPSDASTVLATVNGVAITQEVYDRFIASNPKNAKRTQEQNIDELIVRELILQDGKSKKVDQDAKILSDLEQLKQQLIINTTVSNQMETNPVTDAELEAEYQKQLAGFNTKEYKARHILLKSEDEARAIITELDGGADFSELAKTKSTGPSGKNGGDLGWFSAAQMVEPFSNAVSAMESGTYTKEPVQTQFGWHVIMKEDERSAVPPTLEEVKDQLQQILVQRHVSDYIDALKAGAKIDMP